MNFELMEKEIGVVLEQSREQMFARSEALRATHRILSSVFRNESIAHPMAPSSIARSLMQCVSFRRDPDAAYTVDAYCITATNNRIIYGVGLWVPQEVYLDPNQAERTDCG